MIKDETFLAGCRLILAYFEELLAEDARNDSRSPIPRPPLDFSVTNSQKSEQQTAPRRDSPVTSNTGDVKWPESRLKICQ